MREARINTAIVEETGPGVAEPIDDPSLRASVLEAFRKLGGVDWLVELGQQQPKIFASLLEKLIRTQAEDDKGDGLDVLARRLIELGRTPCSSDASFENDADGSPDM